MLKWRLQYPCGGKRSTLAREHTHTPDIHLFCSSNEYDATEQILTNFPKKQVFMRDFTYSNSKNVADINDHSKAYIYNPIFRAYTSTNANYNQIRKKLKSKAMELSYFYLIVICIYISLPMKLSYFYLMGQSICNGSLTLSCSLLPLQ